MTMRASADGRIVDRVLHQKTFYGRRILLGAKMRAMTAVKYFEPTPLLGIDDRQRALRRRYSS
jgi:hypothetical protein